MKVYQHDNNGYFKGITEDYGGGMPHNCTDKEPPVPKEKYKVRWNGTKWLQEVIPVPKAENGKEVVWNSEKGEYEQKDLPKTLDEIKVEEKENLKNTRNELEQSPIEYKENLFDYDEKSISRIDKARGFIGRNNITSITWTTAKNTQIELTVDDFNAIDDAAAIRSNWLHGKYNEAKMKIDKAKMIEEIGEITKKAYVE